METIESFKPIYQAFLESNLTARDFCKKLEIPESRFYYWQKRIRDKAARSNGEFMPVSINNHAGKVVLVGNGRQQQVRHHHGMNKLCDWFCKIECEKVQEYDDDYTA